MIQNILLGSLIIAFAWLLFYMWNNNLFKYNETIVRLENQQDQDRVYGVNERNRHQQWILGEMLKRSNESRDRDDTTEKAMTSKIEVLEKKIWMLENPPKWKKGDKVGDVVVTDVQCHELSNEDKVYPDALEKFIGWTSWLKYGWKYHGVYKSTGEKVTFANAYEADRLNKKRK